MNVLHGLIDEGFTLTDRWLKKKEKKFGKNNVSKKFFRRFAPLDREQSYDEKDIM